jgi:colanic acid/amylovoran biosynthesis glycosyltransferase
MGDDDVLLVLPALTARAGSPSRSGNDRFVVTQKFVDGVLEYVQRWPGRVVVAMERNDRAGTNLDHVEVDPANLPFELRWLPDAPGLAALIGEARIVLGSLVDKHIDLAGICGETDVPLVYISEYSVLTRRQIIRAETSNPILRWRRELWTTQLEKRYRKAVAAAAGIQCNGTPTFEAYRSINPRSLLYFDTRVRADQLAQGATLENRFTHLGAGQPLRLAFSGRLIAMKGADHLPTVAAELRRRGVPFTFDICGGGALEGQLRGQLERLGLKNQVRLRGVLDFQSQLMPFVASEVDLFVCCHRQGDPSCTYLETMSCGTPIVGYDNEAFAGLVKKSNVGWLTPLDRPAALAERIEELHRNREELVAAANASLEFARNHTFERTMQARVDHMLQCAAAREVGAGA